LERTPGEVIGECEVRGDDIGRIGVHIVARVNALAGPTTCSCPARCSCASSSTCQSRCPCLLVRLVWERREAGICRAGFLRPAVSMMRRGTILNVTSGRRSRPTFPHVAIG